MSEPSYSTFSAHRHILLGGKLRSVLTFNFISKSVLTFNCCCGVFVTERVVKHRYINVTEVILSSCNNVKSEVRYNCV